MKGKTIVLLLIFLALIVFAINGLRQTETVIPVASDSGKNKIETPVSEVADNKESFSREEKYDIQRELPALPLVVVTEDAVRLDEEYFEDHDLSNPGSLVSKLNILSVGRYETAEDAWLAIDEFMQENSQNPYLGALLATLCTINEHPFRVENYKNHETPFNTALFPNCKFLTRKYDPFWRILQLAREGDEYMQLIAPDVFKQAVRRYSIKHFSEPMEYMILRDEVFGYLESLAAKGVATAASKLHWEYLGMTLPEASFLPRNTILAYYYGRLAEKLGSVDLNEYFLDNIERKLSTEEIMHIEQKIAAVQ